MLFRSIEDFKTLAPDQTKEEFKILDLGSSIELLNRGVFNTNNIHVEYVYDKNDKTIINQSFHNTIQMMNNLLINSIKALSTIGSDKKIKIEIFIKDSAVYINVYDNGIGIKDKIKDRIFDLHYSTTNGSGIGLYHTKYLVEDMNGSIEYNKLEKNYNTLFTIKFPTNE